MYFDMFRYISIYFCFSFLLTFYLESINKALKDNMSTYFF